MSIKRILLVLLAVLFLVLPGSQALAVGNGETFPPIIQLPDGFAPEGIATGRGTPFYVGSLLNGSIYKGDLRTGEGDLLVHPQPGRIAVGLKVDARSNNLFVSGGPTGTASIYDAETGAEIATVQLTNAAATFINDVIITREAAYFSDSFNPVLYMLPVDPGGRLSDPVEVMQIPLSGDWEQVPGAFNANGIAASANGKTLLVANSAAQTLYRIDPETGFADAVDLGEALPNGDGMLLVGHTLYVVQNFLNRIAAIELEPDFGAGEIVEILTHAGFQIPTTIARLGNSLYVVNARFNVPPAPDVEYTVVKVNR